MLRRIKRLEAVPGVWELAHEQEWNAEQYKDQDLQVFVSLHLPVLIWVLSDQLVYSSKVGEGHQQEVEHDEHQHLGQTYWRV